MARPVPVKLRAIGPRSLRSGADFPPQTAPFTTFPPCARANSPYHLSIRTRHQGGDRPFPGGPGPVEQPS
jgi:hypothetical protein